MVARAPGSSLSPATRRRAVVMADQAASSLSNVVVSIFVARALPPEGFGAFGVAFVAFLLTQGIARALIGEPLLSRFSAAPADTRRALVPDMLGTALTVAGVAIVAVTVAGLAVGGPAGSALLALACVLPLVLIQDTWRYAFIVDRPGAALAVDVVWLVTVCAVLPAAPADAGAPWFVIAWGLSGGVGALAGVVLGRASLGRPHPTRWLRANRDMGGRFLGEFATGQAVGQLVLVGTGAIAGLGVLAAVRATQVFYGPLNTVHQGIYLALVPEGARAAGPSQLRRLMVKATVLIVAIAVAWTIVGQLLPDAWGRALLGDTWSDAQDLLLLMGLASVAGSAATGGFAGVRSLGAARESLRARLRTVGPQLVLPLAGRRWRPAPATRSASASATSPPRSYGGWPSPRRCRPTGRRWAANRPFRRRHPPRPPHRPHPPHPPRPPLSREPARRPGRTTPMTASRDRLRVAILWQGMAGYTHAAFTALQSQGAEVTLFHRALRANQQFDGASITGGLRAHEWRGEPDADQIETVLDELEPHALLVSSWHIGAYRRAARRRRGATLRILCMDNQWWATPRQLAGVASSRLLVRPAYDAAFVPGERSADFARRLGFRDERIIRGIYSCDHAPFDAVAEARGDASLPRAFVFVGRLEHEKGIDVLAAAYRRYRELTGDPWPLVVGGVGSESSRLVGLPGVDLAGFVQPDELPGLLGRAGCLVLPSRFEPWGVVVHEATAAGLPVLCTSVVGAAGRLVLDGYNGVVVPPGDADALARGLLRLSRASDRRRAEMAVASRSLARQFTPGRWASHLLDRIHDLRDLVGLPPAAEAPAAPTGRRPGAGAGSGTRAR